MNKARENRVLAIAREMEEAMKEIENKYGVTIKRDGSIKVSDEDFSIKYDVVEVSNEDPKALYDKQVEQKGLTNKAPEFGTEFKMNGKMHKVVGFKPSARKNNIVIQQLSNGKKYVTSIHEINICLGNVGLTLEEPPRRFA